MDIYSSDLPITWSSRLSSTAGLFYPATRSITLSTKRKSKIILFLIKWCYFRHHNEEELSFVFINPLLAYLLYYFNFPTHALVLDRYSRLRSTLCHEMCHAATFIIDRKMREGHGNVWKRYR